MLSMLRNLGGAALSSSSESILEIFTSEVAIIIYILIILAIIAVLVISVIFSQRKEKDEPVEILIDENIAPIDARIVF